MVGRGWHNLIDEWHNHKKSSLRLRVTDQITSYTLPCLHYNKTTGLYMYFLVEKPTTHANANNLLQWIYIRFLTSGVSSSILIGGIDCRCSYLILEIEFCLRWKGNPPHELTYTEECYLSFGGANISDYWCQILRQIFSRFWIEIYSHLK